MLCFHIYALVFILASSIIHGPTPPPRFWTTMHLQLQHPIGFREEASTFQVLHRFQKYMASCMLYLIISNHGRYKKAVGNHPTQEDQERKWMYAYLSGCLSRVSLRARLNRVLIFTLRVCWRWLYWWDHILLLLKDGAMEAFKSLDAYDVAVYGFLYVLSEHSKL